MLALVAAAVLSAAPDAGPAPFSWDVPGQVQLVPVGKQLEGGGLPMAVFLAKSTWELDRLLLHYAGRFAEAGYFIPPKMGRITGLKLPRVVALDDVRMVSFLVYGWPEPDGTTTLVLGAADLQNRKQAKGGSLPVFPGAKGATGDAMRPPPLSRTLSCSLGCANAPPRLGLVRDPSSCCHRRPPWTRTCRPAAPLSSRRR